MIVLTAQWIRENPPDNSHPAIKYERSFFQSVSPITSVKSLPFVNLKKQDILDLFPEKNDKREVINGSMSQVKSSLLLQL